MIPEAAAGARARGAEDREGPLSQGPSRYKLLEPLGRGGGGVVYAALDRELNRRVAIKLLRAKAGASGSQSDSQARLVREAQAMARVAHPNVIPVYDVAPHEPGELGLAWPELAADDEVPADRGVFVVMELVEGNTLSEWLQQRRRGWREVLAVLLPAGRGLAAAHAEGLVHRDFKPGNVLIGDDGRPRVLDFGLARPSEQPRSEGSSDSGGDKEITTLETPLTQTGTVLGTPPYMAPEQHRGEPSTEATDQFAFCVVLYEALCGRRPFRGKNLRELKRQKTSGALEPPPAGVRLPRWLWAAVQRGLSPEPAQRFPTMQALLSALDEAPRARRRMLAAVGAVAAVGVGIGAFGWLGRGTAICAERTIELSSIWNEPARTEIEAAFLATKKPFAATAWTSVKGSINDYVGRWGALRELACLETRVEQTQPVDVMKWRDQCLDGARDGLQELLRQFRSADAEAVQHAVEAVSGLPPIERCASTAVAETELARSEQEREQRAELAGELARARALFTMAKYEAAEERATDVLAEAERAGYGAIAARAHIELGLVAIGISDAKRAENELHTALNLAEEIGDEEAATEAGVHLARVIGVMLERYEEADRLAEQVAARLRRRGKEDALAAEFQRTLGAVRHKQGRYEEALAAFERLLEMRSKLFPPEDPAIAQAVGAIGLAQIFLARYAEADESLRRSVDLYVKSVGETHPLVGKMMNRIAMNAASMGKTRAAIDTQRRALEILERSLSPSHMDILGATTNLAVMLHKAGDEEEALAASKHAIEIGLATQGKKHPNHGIRLGNHALILRALGRHEEAVATLKEQLEVFENVFEGEHVNLGYPHLNLASVLGNLERYEEAREHAVQALEIWERTMGPSHDMVATALSSLCQLELHFGRRDRARKLCERGLKIYGEIEGFEDLGLLGNLSLNLAAALPASRRNEAIDLALRAREAFGAAGKDHDLEEAEKWLRERGVKLPPLKSTKPPAG